MEAKNYLAEDLYTDQNLALVWHGNSHSPADVLTEADKQHLQNLRGIEVTFPENFDGNNCDQFLKNFILRTQKPTYIFYLSHFAPKTKRRSYLKIFNPKHREAPLQPSDYVQIEIDYPNNYSLLACVIQVKSENIDYCLEHFSTYHGHYLVSDNTSIFTENFIRNTVEKTVIPKFDKEFWHSKYLLFVLEYCREGTFLFHSVVDGGDRIYWNVYLHKADVPQIMPLIEETVRAFEF
jgi:hypothetical protein